jgi:hypothetical protein
MIVHYFVELQIDSSQIISVDFEAEEGLKNKEIERTAVRKLKKLIEHASLSEVTVQEKGEL